MKKFRVTASVILASILLGSLCLTALAADTTVLPSTGGIGTTIFYIVGAILVVAAAVFLITKRRMSGMK